MSSVSSIAGNQQQYFQISQNQTRPALTDQSAAADTSKAETRATSETAASSSAPKTQTPASQNVNPPQTVNRPSGIKYIESAATRNGDGTFGPKHTFRPPLSYTLLHDKAPAAATVDVKA